MNPRQEFLTTFFRELETNGVRYCVMRNYVDLYAAQDTDVDLLVSPHSLERFEQCLRAAAARTGFRFVHEARYTNYSQVYWHPDSGFTRIDFEEDIRWKLFPVLEAAVVLDERIPYDEFYIPAPWHESVILFVAVIWRGFLSERYREQLALLYAACPDKAQLRETLKDAFGGIGDALTEFQAQVRTREFDRAWARRLRRSLIGTNHRRGGRWLGLIRNTVTDIRRLWARLRTPAGISLLFVSASAREQNFEELIQHIEFLFPAQKNILKTFDLSGQTSARARWGVRLRWLRLWTLFKGGLFVRVYRVGRDTEMLPIIRTHARYLYPSRTFVCMEDSQDQFYLAQVSDGFMAGHAPATAASPMNFSQSFIEFVSAILGHKNNVDRSGPPAQGVFCALVGLDGAGKTTLARHLCELALGEARFPGARYFHWQPELLRDVQFPLPEFRNLPRKMELPRSALNALLSVTRLTKNVVLANLTYWVRIRPLLRRGYLVLVDRYFYNYWLDPVSVKYYGPPGLLALAGRLFPAPELIITLSAPPEVLLQRKQELSEPEIRRQAATLSALKFSAPVLAADASRPASEVAQTVMRRIVATAK
jgi:thymidylate kinase